MIGWVDGSAGVSGDMLLGAVVDAGVALDDLQQVVDAMEVGSILRRREVRRGPLRATKVNVEVPDEPQPHRRLADVRELLARLEGPVADTATAVFERLAAAEARVHGTSVAEVVFHEVGAVDAIVDVAAGVAGVQALGIRDLHASALALGRGRTGSTAHGRLPVPAPAVLELLRGVPVQAGVGPGECTTPTGAALLSTLVATWGDIPTMVLDGIGHGAGTRDDPDHANVLRLAVGRPVASGAAPARAVAWQLEANVDDMDPRLWPEAIARILDAGASDAWLTPIQMKKGRPAFTLSVLTSHEALGGVRTAVFAETSTIGVRELQVGKTALDRQMSTVEVDGHDIAVKTSTQDGRIRNVSVEWEDVHAAAAVLGRPAKEVLARATEAAWGATAEGPEGPMHDVGS